MLKNANEAHTVMFEENGFAIKVSVFGHYYIEHDDCPLKTEPTDRCVAYDMTEDGEVIHSLYCRRCDKQYSKEMDGFINMLNWEK